jgi:tripartite-type tricarboxylate transporter receptor subunit TctC
LRPALDVRRENFIMIDTLRRGFLRVMGSAALLAAVPQLAVAQDYPAKPLRLVVGFPAGGPNDIQGRMIAVWLSARLGQPVNVDNKPGASSNPATEEVVRAAPDGYTLLLVGPANTINPSLYSNLPFDFLRDIAPVASVIREPLVMVVHPSVAANTVAEFIALTKANPGKLKMASTGKGSSPHLTGLLFTSMTGVDLEIVQYVGGGPALKGMIDGQAQMMFEPMSAAIEPVRSGKLRALAVTTTARSTALPDVPALSDAVPGYEASALTGIGVPAKTPLAIVERLNKEINAGLADPALKQRFVESGGIILGGSPADFGKMLTAETEKWAKVIKSSGAKP